MKINWKSKILVFVTSLAAVFSAFSSVIFSADPQPSSSPSGNTPLYDYLVKLRKNLTKEGVEELERLLREEKYFQYVNLPSKGDEYPIYTFVVCGGTYNVDLFTSVIKTLMRSGASIDCSNGEGDTPLHCAVSCYHVTGVQILLKLGAKVNVHNIARETPLHTAVRTGRYPVDKIQELLKRPEIKVNEVNKNGMTPLMLAVSLRSTDVVKTLLADSRVNINMRGQAGNTALHFASRDGWGEGVKLLLKSGADATIPNDDGRNSYEVGVNNCSPEVSEMVHKKFPGVLPRRRAFSTSFSDDERTYGVSYNLCAEQCEQYKKKKRPLHIFVEENKLGVISWALRNNVDEVDCKDSHGDTPLHYAVRLGRFKVAKLLMKFGADVRCKGRWGKTPFKIAEENSKKGSPEMQQAYKDLLETMESYSPGKPESDCVIM